CPRKTGKLQRGEPISVIGRATRTLLLRQADARDVGPMRGCESWRIRLASVVRAQPIDRTRPPPAGSARKAAPSRRRGPQKFPPAACVLARGGSKRGERCHERAVI